MKVAYVGDFINHGKFLPTFGTSLVILLARLKYVTSIDVFCPEINKNIEDFKTPDKVNVVEFYSYDNPISLLKFLRISWNEYDTVIFNMLATGFGNSSVANTIGLIIPICLTKIFGYNNIKIIYHNSIFTNDIKKLGYNSLFDRIRSFFLKVVETILLKSVEIFVLLDLYKQRIDAALGKNLVQVYNPRFLDEITTLYINNSLELEKIENADQKTPAILMHGSWGPQKNIELGLSVLRDLRKEGISYKLIISGGINHHFPEYAKKFRQLLDSYSDIIDEYLGIVEEREIMNLFLNASLIILPYNTPGGHSAVLEQAIFFEVPTIAIDFPEYREQVAGNENVFLIESKDMTSNLILSQLKAPSHKIINLNMKIQESQRNVEHLLKEPFK